MQKANAKRARDGGVMTDDERMKLVSTETSLAMDPDARIPSSMSGLESFSLGGHDEDEDDKPKRQYNAESLFNLPAGGDDDDDEDEDDGRSRRR